MEQEILKVPQTRVAQALAADYFCIYYVNVNDNRFIEYSASPEYRAFGLPSSGDDIISFSREHFEGLIYPEDRELFLKTFTRENIIEAINTHGTFTMTFRMMFDGVPTHVHLKVTRMIEEEIRHLVIGISSVDEQMRAREAFEQAHHASIAYSRVAQALAGDYFSIYVVDPDTDRFEEYSASEEYNKLEIEKQGDDFFNVSRKNMSRLIYEGDKDRFMGTFTKEKIMSILKRDGSFTMKYRLMFGETPVYVSMKATLLKDEHGSRLIFGTNNIDAQMKREAEYRARMEEARMNARNDFLANMSHDIRTPMNAIVGYTNIAKNRKDDPAAVNDALDKISSASHFLLSLINDILDISKIESGKMQLTEAVCDLGDIFRRIEDITALQAKNKALIIRYDYNSVKHYKVLADELRVEQILVNIISNAIKYTPKGGTVDLLVEETGQTAAGRNHYRFVVRDTGIGISEDYLPHIFESFTREENTKLNRVQGTGLGLAITAKIVELMGGTISVESKVGEGSVFTVELSLLPVEEDGARTETEADHSGLRGKRILLVEDNAVNAEIAAMILEEYGVRTETAENGKIGVDLLKDKPEGYFDAVLMDIQMPVMNGYEASKEIRSLDSSRKDIPIIAMSANAYDEDVKDCLKAGMNAHIAKPFAPENLVSLLRQYVVG